MALVAAATYALARISLARFYAPFGVAPEEVGWDLQKVLTGFVLIFGVIGIVVAASTIVLVTLVNELAHLPLIGHSHDHEPDAKYRPFKHWTSGAFFGAVASIGVVAVGALTVPGELGRRVAAGEVPESTLMDSLPIAPRCIEVHQPDLAQASSPLILLGSSAETIVAWDPQVRRSLRVRTGSYVITSSTDCRTFDPGFLFF